MSVKLAKAPEVINNQYGTAYKYPDGRLECFGTYDKIVTYDGAFNGMYRCDTVTLIYPIDFIDLPLVTLSLVTNGDGMYAFHDVTNKYAYIFVMSNVKASNVNLKIRWKAEGKWK